MKRDFAPDLRLVPLTNLQIPRWYLKISSDQQTIQRMVNSIRASGGNYGILLTNEDGMIIDGVLRYQALKEMREELVKCAVINVPQDDQFFLAWRLNGEWNPIDPIHVAKYLDDLQPPATVEQTLPIARGELEDIKKMLHYDWGKAIADQKREEQLSMFGD